MSASEISSAGFLTVPRHTAWLASAFALQTLALRLVDSAATVGYVAELGVASLPWVWIADLLLTLTAGALYLRVVERWHQERLVRGLLLASGAGYLLCAAALWAGAETALCYPLLYVWSALQAGVLPMTLWTLANDLHHPSAQASLFPRIAAGQSLGHLLGYAFTAWVGERFASAPGVDVGLLLGGAGLCVASAVLLPGVSSGDPAHSPATPRVASADADSTAACVANAEALEPGLRTLAFSVFFGWMAMTVIVFHVMANLESAAPHESGRLRTLYAVYNFALTLLTLSAQWVSGRWLARRRLAGTFQVLPLVMLLGLCAALVWPGFAAACALAGAMYLVYDAWDVPARHAWLGGVPAVRRARATALLDNHAFAAGSAVASAGLGLLARDGGAAIAGAPWYLGFGAVAALASWMAARSFARQSHAPSVRPPSR